jgi:integrase
MATVRRRTWTTPKGQKHESWRVRYVDQHGITRTRQFDLKRDADAFRVKAESEVLSGVHTADSASVTVAEASDLWIATAQGNRRDAGTIKSYRELANLHVKPLIGSEKLSRLTQPKVVAFADALKATRSLAMASKAVRALSMILADAMRRGLVAQNVARGVTVARSSRDKARATPPPIEHLKALLEAADTLANEDPALPVMLRLAMLAGPRQSELRAFIWPNADFAGRELHVCQRADRWGAIGAPKSAAGTRSIPIGPTLASNLKQWKLRCPPNALNLVFPGRAGAVLKQHTMASKFLKLQVAAGLAIDTGKRATKEKPIWAARYGWHDLRHAAASAWIAQGVDLKRLQVWIGHENIQLTLDTYGHLIKDAKKDAELASGSEAALLA